MLPTSCSCILLTNNGQRALLKLTAYATLPLTKYDYIDHHLSNLTKIVHFICTFVQEHALQRPYITWVIDEPYIEYARSVVPRIGQQQEIVTSDAHHHTLLQHHYTYPAPDYGYVIDSYTVSQILLLQCHLIAKLTNTRLLHVSSCRAALLHAYKQYQGVAYRLVQLGIDLHRVNNNAADLFDSTLVRRLVEHNNSNLHQNSVALAAAFGDWHYQKE